MPPRRLLRPRPDRIAGIALVAVLGLISLLIVLSLGVLDATRRHGQMSRRSMEAAQAREFADSALRLAMLEWSTARSSADIEVLGPKQIELFGTTANVILELESGRIDLNAADELLLTAAFAGNGYEASEARQLAARILDWRDADDVTNINGGAERSEYRLAGKERDPRNAPFESVRELQGVWGLESIQPELLDAFTVYTQATDPRPGAGPPVVDNALRWADRERLGGRRWLTESHETPDLTATLAGEVARLHACTEVNSLHVCRRSIVRFTGNAGAPWLVFVWESVAR